MEGCQNPKSQLSSQNRSKKGILLYQSILFYTYVYASFEYQKYYRMPYLPTCRVSALLVNSLVGSVQGRKISESDCHLLPLHSYLERFGIELPCRESTTSKSISILATAESTRKPATSQGAFSGRHWNPTSQPSHFILSLTNSNQKRSCYPRSWKRNNTNTAKVWINAQFGHTCAPIPHPVYFRCAGSCKHWLALTAFSSSCDVNASSQQVSQSANITMIYCHDSKSHPYNPKWTVSYLITW